MVVGDPLLFVFLAPALLLALWARTRVSLAYARGSRVPSALGLTGAQAAEQLLRAEGVEGVAIEAVAGPLADHYDPRDRVLRLSGEVFHGRSLAALGVAAHEVGHAIQEARRFAPLVVRNFLVPVTGISANLSWIVLLAGLVLAMMRLILAGIVLFTATVALQVVNLPIEADASRRARQALKRTGMISSGEDAVVAAVLNAAALTSVAATATSLLTLVSRLFGFARKRTTGGCSGSL